MFEAAECREALESLLMSRNYLHLIQVGRLPRRFPWLASVGQLVVAAAGLRHSSSWHEQWYVELEHGLDEGVLDHITASSGAAFGLNVAG